MLDPIKDMIDYSNYSPDHPLYNTDHQNELTYWKSDVGDRQVVKFIGLRPKSYMVVTRDARGLHPQLKTAMKGISKRFRTRTVTNQFYQALWTISSVNAQQYSLRSTGHVVSLRLQQRVAFSSLDTKTYLLPWYVERYGCCALSHASSSSSYLFSPLC